MVLARGGLTPSLELQAPRAGPGLCSAPMRVVYLCRHAKAAPGDPDELRELTSKGVDQARGLGRELAASTDPPAIVLTSPLLRARQTAEIVATETGAELRVEPLLAPGRGSRRSFGARSRTSPVPSRRSGTSPIAPRSPWP